MAGRLLRAFVGGRTARLQAVVATEAAEEARRAHALGVGGATYAAEGIVAAMLLASHIKGEERILLQFQGSRPRFALVAEVDAEGHVRARLSPSDVPHLNSLDGIFMVIKSDDQKELYRGLVEARGQTVEQALTSYFASSQQVDAVLRIAVRFGPDGSVAFAGGFSVERLPESADLPWVTPAAFAARYEALASADVEEVIAQVAFEKLDGDAIEALEARDVVWRCRCSIGKVEGTLAALGVTELLSMADEGGAEVICHFCNTAWRVPPDRLHALAGRPVGEA